MNANSIARGISVIGFLLLFPGFVFYHYVISAGLAPPLLGGLFGPVSLVLFLSYLALLPMNLGSLLQAGSLYTVGVFGFVFYVLLVTLAHTSSFNWDFIQAAGEQSYGVLVFWVSLFFLGFFLPLENRVLKWASLFCALAITGFILHYVATTGSVFFYARELYDADEGVATYQGFARSSLGLWILLVVTARSEFFRWLMVVSGVFVLFVLGARSELFAFMALSILLLVVLGMRSLKTLFFATVACAALVAVVMANMETLSESRQLQILDLRSSTSWNARQVLEDQAWEVIKENPIWGQFASHTTRGGIGFYAHNYLSAWENYGLIGVTSYLMLTIVPCFIGAYWCFIETSRFSQRWLMSFVVNAVCLILIIASKPVFWPLVAFGWGLHANALGAMQRSLHTQPRPGMAPGPTFRLIHVHRPHYNRSPSR
ncbi:hypothetical protein [Aquibaculum sediminis]|uniref:hypothetical protein n=1 Tax=Aquibaculum sediminis TaxID=3231907 RepID=UPI0034536BFD